MRHLALSLVLALSACGGTVIQERPQIFNVPVHTDCVTERPEPPKELHERFSKEEWCTRADREAGLCVGKTIKQKSSSFGMAYLDQVDYGKQLNAATGACK